MATLPNYDRLSLLSNGGFEAYTATVLDTWAEDENGTSTLVVVEDTDNEDAFSLSCAAVTYTHNVASSLQQAVPTTYLEHIASRGVSFQIRVNCSVADAIYPWVSEDGGVTKQYGRGNGEHGVVDGYETLKCEGFALTTAASALTVGVEFRKTCVAYLDNATLVQGSAAADMQDTFDRALLKLMIA